MAAGTQELFDAVAADLLAEYPARVEELVGSGECRPFASGKRVMPK